MFATIAQGAECMGIMLGLVGGFAVAPAVILRKLHRD